MIPRALKRTLVAVVPDVWVYQAANKLIEQHDDDALKEATRLFFPRETLNKPSWIARIG